jgi:predicted esterase
MTEARTSALLIRTTVHGRVLLRAPLDTPALGLLTGFHGYAESASAQLDRLAAVPGADAWALLSVQALHRFYRGSTKDVVACWMTREDRDDAIRDNLAYVDAAVEEAGRVAPDGPVVYAGFSQGAPMAYRAAVCGSPACAGVIAVGGEIAPELLVHPLHRFPPTLVVRGSADEWYTAAQRDADVRALRDRGAAVRSVEVDGAHEWSAAVAEAAGEFLAAIAGSSPAR